METKEVVLKAGPHDRWHCPVFAPLKDAGVTQVSLRESGSNTPVPCQVVVRGGRATNCPSVASLHWIVEDLKAGQEKKYQLTLGAGGGDQKGGVLLEKTPEHEVRVSVAGKLATAYRFGPGLARPHLYPLIGPHGDGVTRRLAAPGDKLDHPHHRSVWIAHGEVNGINNWAETPGHGRTKHTGFDALESGPVLGRIVAKGDWVGPEGWACPTRANKLLEETAEWTFYNTPTLTFDLRLTLKAMDMDVLFADTKEGGLASIRVEESMEVRRGGRIENAYGGIGEKEAWGKPAHWCDYSGPVNGRIVGVTIMDAPDSFRHPTRWHVRDYGLMTANPFGLSHYTGDIKQRSYHVLPAGEELRASYRFYVHAGDATEGRVREKYHDFANPPVAQIV